MLFSKNPLGPHPALLALLQIIGVMVYCGMIALLLSTVDQGFEVLNQQLAIFFMLLLYVFSAAVVGTLIFGTPVYFALKEKFQHGLTILAFELLYSFAFIVIFFAYVVARG